MGSIFSRNLQQVSKFLTKTQILTMLPPKYTKTVTVTAHDTPATISVVYDSNKEDKTVVEVELAQGESHTFEEKTEDMGSWQAVRKILTVRGKINDAEFEKTCEYDCEGIHSNIHYTVHKEERFNLKNRN